MELMMRLSTMDSPNQSACMGMEIWRGQTLRPSWQRQRSLVRLTSATAVAGMLLDALRFQYKCRSPIYMGKEDCACATKTASDWRHVTHRPRGGGGPAAATPACRPSEKTAQPGISYAPTMAIVDYDCLIVQLEGQKW